MSEKQIIINKAKALCDRDIKQHIRKAEDDIFDYFANGDGVMIDKNIYLPKDKIIEIIGRLRRNIELSIHNMFIKE